IPRRGRRDRIRAGEPRDVQVPERGQVPGHIATQRVGEGVEDDAARTVLAGAPTPDRLSRTAGGQQLRECSVLRNRATSRPADRPIMATTAVTTGPALDEGAAVSRPLLVRREGAV